VVGDSLIGTQTAALGQRRGSRVAVPLAAVMLVEEERVSAGRSVGLVLGLAVALGRARAPRGARDVGGHLTASVAACWPATPSKGCGPPARCRRSMRAYRGGRQLARVGPAIRSSATPLSHRP
jgi:hypothetical protein